MLKIKVPKGELFNDRTGEFIQVQEQELTLEHSLVSVSKWESKWKKPFLDKKGRTQQEIVDYIRCMTLTQNVRPEVYKVIDGKTIQKVLDYIDDPMTATWFSNEPKSQANKRTVTNELIYCWMINLGIPMECQKWHLNRLMTLIKVCDLEGSPKKKMSGADLAKRNRSLNAARKARMKTNG